MISPTGPAAIRVALADDHDLVRSGLKLLLESIEGVTVVCEARDGNALLAAVRAQPVDLVVTDISMGTMDGLTALARLRELPSPPRVLIVSMHDSPDFIRRALVLGAAGYLMKNGSPVELEHAVRAVMLGHTYYSPQIAQRLAQSSERPPEALLTERQLEILRWIGQGRASKEIAYALGLSSKTVDVHRARIMERLGIDNVAGLALYCARHGLIDPHQVP